MTVSTLVAITSPASTGAMAQSALLDGFEVLDAGHREVLARLDELIALVAELNDPSAHADAQSRARHLIDFFSTTMRRHNQDEERHVFPSMLAAGEDALTQLVLNLREDHAWIELDWLEIEPYLASLLATRLAGRIGKLQAAVDAFAALWREHIALEEAMLYPQARRRIPVNERRAMRRKMLARRRRELKKHPADSASAPPPRAS